MFDSFVSHKHTKLVDADAMKDSIKSGDTDEYRVISTKELHEALNEWIDGRPPVDAVPVVRCKDCRYGHRFFDVINGTTDSWIECRNPDGLNRDTSEDSFCSYGERKKEE